MPTQESSTATLQEGLEFFRKYREFIFSGSPAVNEYMTGAENGPVPPWSDYNPYPCPSDGWTHLLSFSRKDLFPVHPFQEGMAPGTYRMWDYILTGGVSRQRVSTTLCSSITGKTLQPAREECLNTFWLENMKHAFSFNVPDSKYMVDFRCIPEGRRMVEAAHALAHYRCNGRLVETSSALKLHSRLTDEFLKAAAEIAVGYYMGLPIDVKTQGVDVPMAYGIQVRPSTVLGFDIDMPVLRVPIRANMGPTINKTLAYVCAVVQVGYDPVKALNSASESNYPQDWWAYQPVRVFIAGWETAAWMSMQKLAYPDTTFWRPRDNESDYACHCKDLLPATTLQHHVNVGREFMKPGADYMYVLDWLESNNCKTMLDYAPPLPCPTCMYMYNDFAGGLCLPRGPKPYKRKKMPDAWVNYFKNFTKAMKLITKAKKMIYMGGGSYRAIVAEKKRNFKRIIAEAKGRIRARKKW